MMNFGVNMQGQHGSPWLTTVQQLTKNPNRNPVVIPREIAKHPFGHGSKPCFDIKVSGVYGSLWPLSQGITMYHRHRLWPIPVCGFFHPTINRWGPPVLASPCHMRGAQNLISLIKHLTQNVTKQISQGPTKGSRLFRFFSPPLDVSAARSPRCAACGQGLSGQRTLRSLGHGNRLRIVP